MMRQQEAGQSPGRPGDCTLQALGGAPKQSSLRGACFTRGPCPEDCFTQRQETPSHKVHLEDIGSHEAHVQGVIEGDEVAVGVYPPEGVVHRLGCNLLVLTVT